MRVVFIYYNDIDPNNLSGIDKKVLTQIREFERQGIECSLITMAQASDTKIKKILARLPGTNLDPEWILHPEMLDCDVIYYRRPKACNRPMLKVLKDVKTKNPGCRIIMEIPNYPYDQEYKRIPVNYPFLIKDRFSRKRLKQVVDRIAVQNDLATIFGIPTLRFINGIDVGSVQIRDTVELSKDTLVLCAVARMEPWQGYERVLKGLSEYYRQKGERQIHIHMAGEGNDLDQYKQLTEKLQISSRITFHGHLTGDELDAIYDQSHLALDAFGRYKTNNEISTSLKSREYLAKGLPVVSGSKSDLFDEHCEFYLEFPSDDSICSMERILSFADGLYHAEDADHLAERIREYAFNVCDISHSISAITHYLRDR